jgi:hypothetical protein
MNRPCERTDRRTPRAIAFLVAMALGVLVGSAAAEAATDTAKTTLKLQILQPDPTTSFIRGKLTSPKAACTKGRKLEALARANGDSGEGTSLRDGTFQIGLGGLEQVYSSNGYEVSVSKKRIGEGGKRTVCEPDDADVDYKSFELTGFSFSYGAGVFSGTLSSSEEACAGPLRNVNITNVSTGGSLGSDQTDANGDWSFAAANPQAGTYRATADGTFGSAQRPKQDGDLQIVNCDEAFTQIAVP